MPRPPTVLPAAASGANSYALLAEHQNDTDDRLPADYLANRYSFLTNNLEPSAGATEFPRASGTRGQTPRNTGQQTVAGDVSVPLGETHIGTWLKHWLWNLEPDTAKVALVNIAAAGSYTAGTAITVTDAKQPYAVIGNDLVDCGRLVFTFASATGAGSIDVLGEDENGTPIDETIEFTAAGTHKSKHYYSKITNYTPKGAVSGGTLKVDCDPEVYAKVIIPKPDIPHGLQMELVKGGVVNTFTRLRVGSGSLDFGDNLGITLNLQGAKALLGKTIDLKSDPTSTTGKAVDSSDVGVSWGTYIKLNGKVIAMESVGLSMDQNLVPSPFSNFNSINPPPSISGGNRIIEVTGVIPYGKNFREFEDLVVGGDVSCQIHCAIKGYGRRHASFTFDFPQCKLNNFPSSPINDLGPIRQTVTLAPYYLSETEPDIKVTAITKETKAQFI